MIRPDNISEVILDGHDLSLEEFVAVARFNAAVKVEDKVYEKMADTRAYVEKILEEDRIAYGINTGFGQLASVAVDKEESDLLSTNLVLSHCTATGDPYDDEEVRGMMLLLINSLSKGFSGARPVLIEMLVKMLNINLIPYVPQKGSLGASGDLAPLSHIGLVLLGKGKAKYNNELLEGKIAMDRAKIEILAGLKNKEGLALTNGTHVMSAVAALNIYDALKIEKLSDVIAALSFSALLGQRAAYDSRVHQLRRQDGQIKVAENMLLLAKGSRLIEENEGRRVQDAYSLRCIPQVHGASRDSIDYIKTVIEKELNAVTDNPLVFANDDDVISGGNFHGEPIGQVMDFLAIAVSEYASIAERRIERMVNAALSDGLTPFLSLDAGVNSGYMIVQYGAASMVSENKVLAHPATVDSIPSSANQEDFVSMATTAARKCSWVIENTLSVLAYELLTACQAIDIRTENNADRGLSVILDDLYQLVRKDIAFMDKDREIRIDIEKIEKIIRDEEIINLIMKDVPELN